MPYGAPPAPDQSYHDAPTQMYGSEPQPPQPQGQPPYAAPVPPYGAPPQSPYGAPADPAFGAQQGQFGAQPPQYGAPQGQFGYPPPPPPKKGNGLVIGLVVAAVVVVGGGVGAYLAFHKSTPTTPISQPTSTATVPDNNPTNAPTTAAPTPTGSGTMTLPASADGLTQITTPAANSEVASVKSGVTSGGGSTYNNALFGAYGPTSNGDPSVVLVAQPLSNLDASDQSDFESASPSDLVSQIMSGAQATDVQTETSSDPNAALSCGTLNADDQNVLTCVWDDSIGFGFGYFFNTSDAATAAQQTDALRAAAEQ